MQLGRSRDGVTRGYELCTHHNECEVAARGDGDAIRPAELGAGAVAVAEASSTAAGKRGGRPSGEVGTADPVVIIVLRCIRGTHAE